MLPHLKLTLITTVDKKYYHLLFFSRVEYQTWKDLIENHDYAYMDLVAYESCIANYGIIPRLTSLSNANNPLNFYEGTLDVYLHQMRGIVLDTDVFLTLQVDYLGGFFSRVFTSDITKMSRDLIFDQKFEISLNCSQTLRINAYKRNPSTFQDFQFFAMGTFELHTAYLSDHYCLVTVPLIPADSRLYLVMSVRFFAHEFKEKQRTMLDSSNDDVLRMWRMRGKVFGQCIKDVLKREERKIPLIVTSCIEEIEQRGLDTSFIYIMRGDDTRVNDLVAVFDICSFTASHYIKQARYTPYDIAEVLTRYLRSLPYSILLCPNNYLPVFTLEDTTVKVRMVAFLLTNIPEPGRTVFSYLLDHMAK
ncbi:breakpoint cluster region protein isoform X2 [Octopus bimaculoides]|uniref:breakpoint cluster region protein isoform X2 n=1 Tax=Octopus bimaculoides TaxID=37653 RepID=UPI00071C42ED|nr:breakpoint cluster region protein isoform X2 [Octopus bimaculoides]|eukprot:XP_014790548.1 PREDICTED: breakpoint cluster region protein-like isoform X2 [Octopus bimaculoides]